MDLSGKWSTVNCLFVGGTLNTHYYYGFELFVFLGCEHRVLRSCDLVVPPVGSVERRKSLCFPVFLAHLRLLSQGKADDVSPPGWRHPRLWFDWLSLPVELLLFRIDDQSISRWNQSMIDLDVPPVDVTSKGTQPCLGLLEKVLLEKAFFFLEKRGWSALRHQMLMRYL